MLSLAQNIYGLPRKTESGKSGMQKLADFKVPLKNHFPYAL